MGYRAWAGLVGSIVLATTIIAARPASAALIELTARPVGTNIIDWSQLGSAFTTFGTPVGFTSAGGNSGSADLSGNGLGQVRQQTLGGWNGNFAPGDYLFWTQFNGPLTLSFNTAVGSVGAQIQADAYGAYTAQIQAFDGATLLGTFTENGFASGAADNSAIFLGVADGAAEITSIVYSLTACSNTCSDFAINQVSLNGPVGVPEPSSLALLGSALLGFGATRRRVKRGWRRSNTVSF